MTFGRALYKTILPAVFLLTVSSVAFSKDFYWIGNSGNWSDPTHWSNTSGGLSCGSIPGAEDEVIFDNASFSKYFPVITLDVNTEIRQMTVSTNFYPVFKGENVSLTLSSGINALDRFSLSFNGNSSVNFTNNSDTYSTISINGCHLESDIYFNGNWELKSHFITAQTSSVHFVSGSIKTNGFTLFSGNLFATENTVNADFTNSTIFGMHNLKLTKLNNTGGPAEFGTEDGSLNNIDKDDFSGSTWLKTTVNCTTASPLVLNLNITSNYNGSDISCNGASDGEITIVASGTPGPYSYSLNSVSGPFSGQTVFSGLDAGTYTVTVLDSSNQLFPGVYAPCNISI
ncbi:MAG: SprB repeat-containing protein, partial [Crocinitomicaceae bacterium]|nr:SprB repeat-containing protein [Crocinitomicaceae bacterium]